MALVLLMEWRAARSKDLRWILWTISLTAAATPLLGMPFSPQWLVLSLPALLLVLSIMDQHWGAIGRWSAVLLFLTVFFGLWMALLANNHFVFLFVFPLLLIFLLTVGLVLARLSIDLAPYATILFPSKDDLSISPETSLSYIMRSNKYCMLIVLNCAGLISTFSRYRSAPVWAVAKMARMSEAWLLHITATFLPLFTVY